MKAIILAAGKSQRLKQHIGRTKLAAKINKLNLICYPIISLSKAGISEIYLVTPRETEGELMTIARMCPATPLIYHVETWRWWAGNGYTLLDALETLGWGEYIVSVADHIYHPDIVKKLIQECDTPMCIAGDKTPKHVNTQEATLILTDKNNYITKIGKHLKKYNYVDTGIHYIKYTPPLKCHKIPLSFNEWKNCTSKQKIFKVIDTTGKPWKDIDTPQDIANTIIINEIIQQVLV